MIYAFIILLQQRADELTESETELSGKTNFQINTFYIIIDTLTTQLNIISETYSDILNIFGCIPVLYKTDSVRTIKNSCQFIAKEFPADIQSSDILLDECLHFKELMKIEEQLFTSVENSVTFTISSYIKSKELDDVFPNLYIVLRMFLSTAVANCTGGTGIFSVKTSKKLFTIFYV